jgi:hypothetical protein
VEAEGVSPAAVQQVVQALDVLFHSADTAQQREANAWLLQTINSTQSVQPCYSLSLCSHAAWLTTSRCASVASSEPGPSPCRCCPASAAVLSPSRWRSCPSQSTRCTPRSEAAQPDTELLTASLQLSSSTGCLAAVCQCRSEWNQLPVKERQLLQLRLLHFLLDLAGLPVLRLSVLQRLVDASIFRRKVAKLRSCHSTLETSIKMRFITLFTERDHMRTSASAVTASFFLHHSDASHAPSVAPSQAGQLMRGCLLDQKRLCSVSIASMVSVDGSVGCSAVSRWWRAPSRTTPSTCSEAGKEAADSGCA